MKSFWKLGAAAAVLFAGSGFLWADTIQLGSFATGAASLGDSNTAMDYDGYSSASTTPTAGTASTFALAPGTTWTAPVANSTWVGFATTAGPVGTSNPAFGYYTFTTSFTALSTSPYSGSLSVMADDTAEVLLNGTVVASFGALGGDGHCADGLPSCLAVDTISLSGVSLLSGVDANTLTFVVHQAGVGPTGGTGDPSGLDFDATLTSAAIPEPSTLLLLGSGLIGFAVIASRARREAVAARTTAAGLRIPSGAGSDPA
jgi:hypothetical protein